MIKDAVRTQFNDSKYTKCYFSIIKSIFAGDCETFEVFEKHHIIPRSLGGSDDQLNLIKVTRRQHILLHWLLTKMCLSKNHQEKMQHAFHLMVFGKIKNSNGILLTTAIKQAAKKCASSARRGKYHSQEAKYKMSKSRLGKKQKTSTISARINALTGQKRTSTQCENISNAVIGFPSRMTVEQLARWKDNCSKSQLGKKLSQNTKQKMSIARKGVKRSLETCKKMSIGQTGRTVNLRTCEKIANALKYTWIIKNTLSGEIFETPDLSKFCEERQLVYSSLVKTVLRKCPLKRGRSKGWIALEKTKNDH